MKLTWTREVMRTASGRDEYNLRWGKHSIASVWSNGVWHTWDRQHTGGENASAPTSAQARRAALIALVRQNASPYKGWAVHAPRCVFAVQRACALMIALGHDGIDSLPPEPGSPRGE